MVLIAGAIAIGGLLNARRVAETMSHTAWHDPRAGLCRKSRHRCAGDCGEQIRAPGVTTHVSVGALCESPIHGRPTWV